MTAIITADFPEFKLIIADCKVKLTKIKGVEIVDADKIKDFLDYSFTSIGDKIFNDNIVPFVNKVLQRGETFDPRDGNIIDEFIKDTSVLRLKNLNTLVSEGKIKKEAITEYSTNVFFFINKNDIIFWRTKYDKVNNMYLRETKDSQNCYVAPRNEVTIFYGGFPVNMSSHHVTKDNIVDESIGYLYYYHEHLKPEDKLPDFEDKFTYRFYNSDGTITSFPEQNILPVNSTESNE